MGTTLTGTTPATTYDSLIKVTDNGPLSGTAKDLTDGLGNDSALAVSTTACRELVTSSGTENFMSGRWRICSRNPSEQAFCTGVYLLQVSGLLGYVYQTTI
jgi:hypothetical protein